MFNIFRKKNNQKRVLKGLTFVFTILDEFSRRGLIHWQAKDKSLLIEETLANLKLAEGREGFKLFLEQIATWQNYKLFQDAYETKRIELETSAIRLAKKQYALLNKADIARIRLNARDGLQEIDIASLNCIKEFSIYIIRANANSKLEANEKNGQLLAVGHFDGENIEMASYEDIKMNINKEK